MTEPMFDVPRACLRCGVVEMIPDTLDTCARCRHLDHRATVTGCYWCLDRQGSTAADAAAQAAEDAADPAWRWAAKVFLREAIRSGEPFTSADITERLRESGFSTRDGRALGAIIRSASRAGLIKPTGRVLTSPLPDHHSGLSREWVAA